MDNFFSSLNLDAIYLVDPLLELESEPASVLEEADLQKAKVVVASLKNQLVGLISNLAEIMEAKVLLINASSIPKD